MNRASGNHSRLLLQCLSYVRPAELECRCQTEQDTHKQREAKVERKNAQVRMRAESRVDASGSPNCANQHRRNLRSQKDANRATSQSK